MAAGAGAAGLKGELHYRCCVHVRQEGVHMHGGVAKAAVAKEPAGLLLRGA